jgi:TonB family protein
MSKENTPKKIEPIYLILISSIFVVIGYLLVQFLSESEPKPETSIEQSDSETNPETDIDTDSTYMVVEVMPEFEGGNKGLQRFIAENVVYPPEAKDQNISGRVFITFVVNQEGKVENVEVLKGVHPLLDEAAIQCIKSLPDFTPGMQDDKPAKVRYNIPINFQLR